MAAILVTGSNGQVGSELQDLSSRFSNFQFTFVDVKNLDITSEEAVQTFFDQTKFDYCINCAAYTAVDKAESENEIAYKVNVVGPKNLSEACLKHQTNLFQLSTDYVYHNELNTPIKESDPTRPKSVYAITKLQGDEISKQINPATTIIRTSWVYSSYGNNFVKTMLRLGRERDEVGVLFDQIGTPTYARDLASAILEIIAKVENNTVSSDLLPGVFHFSNEGVTSWYDFAQAIFEIEHIDCQVNAIETKDYPTAAKRPPFSLLNKVKIKSAFGLDIPHWRTSLNACLKALKVQS